MTTQKSKKIPRLNIKTSTSNQPKLRKKRMDFLRDCLVKKRIKKAYTKKPLLNQRGFLFIVCERSVITKFQLYSAIFLAAGSSLVISDWHGFTMTGSSDAAFVNAFAYKILFNCICTVFAQC